MANPTTTRLSPAELRRRLLAPPTDAVPAVVEEESPAPTANRFGQRRSDSSRFGSSTLAQSGYSLDGFFPPSSTRSEDALAKEEPDQQSAMARTTPLPESQLDLSRFRTAESKAGTATPVPLPSISSANDSDLRVQNAELSRIVEEMRPVLEEASLQEERFQKKEAELIVQLAEKDRLNEELLTRLKQVEEQFASIPAPKLAKGHNELEEWSDELEKESSQLTQDRRRIEEDRRQLRDDEEALEKQMREMEVSMARERAMMGRQETELKRLSAEIQHELETIQRGDGTLRDQLSKFQRRHQEVLSRTPTPGMAPPQQTAPEPTLAVAPSMKDSGGLRRFFRGK